MLTSADICLFVLTDAEPDTSLYILMYQALEEYDMKDMSPESWRDFAERYCTTSVLFTAESTS